MIQSILGVNFVADEWENSSGSPGGTEEGARGDFARVGSSEAPIQPSASSPDDAAPPNVVSASQPTGPASQAPESTHGSEIAAGELGHAVPEPEQVLEPEHEP